MTTRLVSGNAYAPRRYLHYPEALNWRNGQKEDAASHFVRAVLIELSESCDVRLPSQSRVNRDHHNDHHGPAVILGLRPTKVGDRLTRRSPGRANPVASLSDVRVGTACAWLGPPKRPGQAGRRRRWQPEQRGTRQCEESLLYDSDARQRPGV